MTTAKSTRMPPSGGQLTRRTHQLLRVWSVVPFAVLFAFGLILARYLPPHDPSHTALQVAAGYRRHTVEIRVGLLLAMVSVAFLCPWLAELAAQTKRVEDGASGWAYTQIISMAMGQALFIFSMIFWTAAAFRPERSPQIIQSLNDLGWIVGVMPFGPFTIWALAIGLPVLSDKHRSPIFPRWFGWFSIWTALLFVPAGLITFFKSGPLAWDGLIGFWLPVPVFGAYLAAATVLLIKAIRQEDTDRSSAPEMP